MSGRLVSPILIGRRDELEAIERALDGLVDGSTRHLLIAGEAGVGKTRLVEELARLAADRGMLVLRGACANIGDGGLPYGPIVDALRGLADLVEPEVISRVVGDNAVELGMLVPSLGRGEAQAGATQRMWLQARVFDALLGLLQRLGATTPTVLVLEDLHWSDQATRETTAFLARALRGAPVLLVMTYRSDELHRRHPLIPWLAELERAGHVERRTLRRLGADEVRELVRAIDGASPDDERVGQIFRRSDGNPFFIEELLAAGGDGGDSAGLPSTLRDVLLARISAIPDAAQGLLGIAAISGQQVDHDLLVGVAGDGSDTLEAIRAAVANQLLLPVVLPDGRDGYAFRHALVQEAVADDLLPGERRRLHRRAAEVLEGRAPGTGAAAAAHWASLAHHWNAAGVTDRAFAASLRAAEAAEATFAFAAALEHDECALDLWDSVPDAAAIAGFDRIALLTQTAQAARLKGDARRDVQLRRQAIAAVGSTEDPARLGILHEQLGRAFWNSGYSGDAVEAYEEAVRLIPEQPPTPERAVVLAGLGQMLMLLDRWEDSRVLCEEAIRVARLVGARAAEGHASNTLGTDLGAQGRCGEAVAALEVAQEIAFEVRQADDIGRSFVNLCEALWICSADLERAAEVAERGIAVADEYGLRSSYGGILRHSSVLVHYELGRWDVAHRRAAEAFSTDASDVSTERDRLTRCGSLLVASGSPEAGLHLRRLAEILRSGPIESQFLAPFHIAMAEHAIWQGRPADALAEVERGVETLATKNMDWFMVRLHRIGARAAADLAEVARARRDPGLTGQAIERLARLRIDRERIVTRSIATFAGASAATAMAESAPADAEESRAKGIVAPAAWRSAAEQWQATRRPYPTAYALWRLGEADLLSGDRAAATSSLAEAAAIADGLGAKPLAAAVAGLARRARIVFEAGRAPDEGLGAGATAGPIDTFGLTARELEVLGLLADGRTNRQIASALFISENTVGVHVSNIFGKLRASGRTEAATIAVRLGIVPS